VRQADCRAHSHCSQLASPNSTQKNTPSVVPRRLDWGQPQQTACSKYSTAFTKMYPPNLGEFYTIRVFEQPVSDVPSHKEQMIIFKCPQLCLGNDRGESTKNLSNRKVKASKFSAIFRQICIEIPIDRSNGCCYYLSRSKTPHRFISFRCQCDE